LRIVKSTNSSFDCILIFMQWVWIFKNDMIICLKIYKTYVIICLKY
jgi:hypothetical protein